MPDSTPAPARGPLDGLLVADFSRILAGPYATMLLADLGAEVIKVESPGGDDTRTWRPPVREGVATYYLAVNRNKRSVALDFKDEDDRAAARKLAARAHVVVENFKPGGLAASALTMRRWRRPTPPWCTPRSAGSAPARAPACPDTT